MSNQKLISHYTSLDSFMKIVQSKSIWATNVLYLNDSREYSHTFDLFWTELKTFEQELSSKKEEDLAFFSEIRRFLKDFDAIGIEHHFVASFSTNLDLLSQWRSYGSIGIIFERKLLEHSLICDNDWYCQLQQCNYENKSLVKEISNNIREIYTNYRKGLESESGADLSSLIVDFQIALYYSAAFNKDAGFKEESEYRLSCATPPEHKIKFRTKGSLLIPYVEVKLDLNSIHSIVIGPCFDADRTIGALKIFLNQHFPDRPPKIYRSKSSYRDW